MRLLDQSSVELKQKLDRYLADDPTYRTVFEYTKQRFDGAKELTAHNWAHAYRDIINAVVIGEAEGADMSVVLPAITMHDIGFLYGATGKTHGAIGADKLSEYLHDGGIEYSDEMIEKIAGCIRTHKGSMHNEKPQGLEAKVVADADLVEKFGPFGVYQLIRTYTEFDWPLKTLLERGGETGDLTLETPTGQKLIEPGVRFVLDFMRELAEAAEPYGE